MKSEIKLTILKLLKFIIVLMIIDFGLGFIAKEVFFSQKTGKFHRTTYAIKKSKDDILIFGSSHAHRHYVPEVVERQLSLSCYNAGAEGQQLLFHRALQKMIFKRITPKIIILNIDENFLFKSDIAFERLSDLHPYYSDYKSELHPILRLNSSMIDFKMLFKSYQTNSTLVHVIKYYLKPQQDYKGYRPLFDETTANKIESLEKREPLKEYEEVIDDIFVNTLVDFIEEAQAKKIKVVFVTSPNLILRDITKNESLLKIKEIAKSKEVIFIDFLNSPNYLNKYNLFHDASHLNDKGAKLFTSSVSKIIKSSI
ncbi:hypothetical protein L3X39_09130 [Sabulilitoribacter multivorans]|uniref:DUF1574 domain-containing protein n=1 Tax=Flaviramulus multivorans TaxID=1304750 RepID=A0ABS9IJM2_9FLAO|nr:hypothetical protein [Flaviramulus multivorans]MCF7560800.1 hypothetical protein [Flaviramulus multivorans]